MVCSAARSRRKVSCCRRRICSATSITPTTVLKWSTAIFSICRDDLYAGSIFKDGSKVGDQAADGSSNGGGQQRHHKSRKDDDPGPVDRDKIEAALNVISSDCSYEIWLKVAAALRYALGEAGFELFDQWSAKANAPQYTPEKSRERWRGARTMTDITIATLFHYADEADKGWRDRYLLDRMNNAFRTSAGADPAGSDAARCRPGQRASRQRRLGCQ